jgi:hypothetical protein
MTDEEIIDWEAQNWLMKVYYVFLLSITAHQTYQMCNFFQQLKGTNNGLSGCVTVGAA